MSGLLDLITGNADSNASDDLKAALANLQGLQLPSSTDLQLGPLAEYYNAGALDPAQMEAASAGPSAFDSERLSAVPFETMQKVLAQEDALASSNGMTPQERARIAQAEEAANTNTAGQRGAIAQSFAGMGVPQSLISAALQNQGAGQDAQNAYLGATNAAAGAADNAQTARQAEGALAGQMYSQESGQANTVAQAQNALNAFNANNVQSARQANQGAQQAANIYNAENGQDVANRNVQGQQSRQIYNQTQAPVTAANLSLERANMETGASSAHAAQQMEQGQQDAGLFAGILGAASNAIPTGHADGGEIEQEVPAIPFVRGGGVPGDAPMPGNAPGNDTVPARLSPGEFVVPRSDMANPKVRAFLAANTHTPTPPATHPSDLSAIMRAMAELRRTA